MFFGQMLNDLVDPHASVCPSGCFALEFDRLRHPVFRPVERQYLPEVVTNGRARRTAQGVGEVPQLVIA